MPKRRARTKTKRTAKIERFKVRQMAVNVLLCPIPSREAYCPTLPSRNAPACPTVPSRGEEYLAAVLRVPPLKPGDLTAILGQLKVPKTFKVLVVAATGKVPAVRKALKKKT